MVHNPATSRKRVVYKPTWTMTTGIGQAYTRIGAQRTSEMLGMTFCNGVAPAITGGKLRHVLEAVLGEIDFQMVEESVERIPGICNRRWLLASKALDATRVSRFGKLCRAVVPFPNHLPNQ